MLIFETEVNNLSRFVMDFGLFVEKAILFNICSMGDYVTSVYVIYRTVSRYVKRQKMSTNLNMWIYFSHPYEFIIQNVHNFC